MPNSLARGFVLSGPGFLLGLTLAAASCVAPVQDPEGAVVERRIDLLFGDRSYDDALPDVPVLEDLNEGFAVGVAFSQQRAEDFLGFELGLAGAVSDDDAVVDMPPFGLVDLDLELTTSELYGGVVKTFRIGKQIRPYVGAGLTLVYVQGDLSSAALGGSDSENDYSPAGYVHTGVLFGIGPSFHLGLDGRAVLGTDLDLEGLEIDADYLQLSIALGWRF